MLRVAAATGSSFELEIWALSAAAFGKFVAAIPPPLSIGTVRLADGRGVKGFIVEPAAVGGARDISAFSGWRAFVAQKAAVVILMVRRRPCAVSNHEAVSPHPSRRGEGAAPV